MRPLKRFVLVVTPFGLAACASVWGFEEATERAAQGDGGPIATGDVTPSNVPGVFCAPRPPEGWIGPLAVAEVTGSPLPPIAECQERWERAFEANANLTVPAAGCGCECDPTPVKQCGAPQATLWSEETCTTSCGTPQAVPSHPPDTCAPFDPGAACPASKDIWTTTIGAVPIGNCEAKQKAPPGPPSWLTGARLCKKKADVIADCGDKSIAPETPVGFDSNNYCILATRVDECPSTYPRKRAYFEPNNFSEERSCEPCTCGAPSGACAGVVQTGDSTSGVTGDCGGGDKYLDVPVPCTKLSKQRAWGYADSDAGAQNVKCEPSGGGILGKVVPAASLTVCCRL